MMAVLNVHLKELSCLLVGENSPLGMVLWERDGSDSPKNHYCKMGENTTFTRKCI